MLNEVVLPTPYQQFIHVSRYARWRDEDNRRETWSETVERYLDFMCKIQCANAEMTEIEIDCIRQAILHLKVMPSMRALMTAGKALARDNAAGFNCAHIAIDSPIAFDELMYLLMCGCGVGLSVERQYVAKLPEIAEAIYSSDTIIKIRDSKLGWSKGLRELINMLYVGIEPKIDYSNIRPAGARLKTFGGRASGPAPLQSLYEYTIRLFKKAIGRKLTSIECHDLCCKIAQVVVVGGVRRSALISLSNLSDLRMQQAKFGNWYDEHAERALANNSVAYTEKPDLSVFMQEWMSLMTSKSGERGIFNRVAARKTAKATGRRKISNILDDKEVSIDFFVNPCGEIILRNCQFCNLSEVVVRPEDTLEDLMEKVRIATIIGTMQSSLTKFRYLRNIWEINTKEEALLGVSLTGIMDHPLLNGAFSSSGRLVDDPVATKAEMERWLQTLKQVAIDTNKEWAERLGVNIAAAITCNKPSGCRPGNALTVTDNGIFMLDELLKDHPISKKWNNVESAKLKAVLGSNKSDNENITKTYRNGTSKLIRITTSYGLQLESTPNHMWHVSKKPKSYGGGKYTEINRFIRADQLSLNDVITVTPGIYNSKKAAPLKEAILPSTITSSRGFEIQQPKEMNADLAWLLGYLYGDGSLSPHKYKTRFSDGILDNIKKAAVIIKKNFGLELKIYKAKDQDSWAAEVCSRHLWEFWKVNGVTRYHADGAPDYIPICVRTSSRHHIIAFISGLMDADGWFGVSNRGCKNGKVEFVIASNIGTSSERFARHIQHIALSVGIVFGIGKNTKGESYRSVDKLYWILSLCLNSQSSSLTDLSNLCEKLKLLISLNPNIPLRAATRSSNAKVLGKILSIEEDHNEVETFDIEVANKHYYYAGAFLSHNTVSQLVDCASGIHPRYSKYYIRTVRGDSADPFTQFLKLKGIPSEPDVTSPNSVTVFSFPVKAPESCVTRDHMTAIEQMELWLTYKIHWCEHNPSVTVYVGEDEWCDVLAWVWRHFDKICGMTFLPRSDHMYKQAPYQEINEEQYNTMLALMPEVDFTELALYETEDMTTSSHTPGCSGNQCELVDITSK